MVVVQFGGFDEKCNAIINEAINYSQREKCKDINTAHIFLALLNSSSTGKMILNHFDLDFKSAYEGYKKLVDNGDFGHSNTPFIDIIICGRLDAFSNSTSKIVSMLLGRAFADKEAVTQDKLMEAILEEQENELVLLMNYLDMDTEEVISIIREQFIIPEALEDFVTDMTSNERILKTTYVDADKYIDEMIEVLGRKKKPNPILVGKAGVGKTAIAEAFAQRVSRGDVPDFLLGKHVCSVEGSVLTAGTRFRGDFEARVKMLLDFIEENDAIMFIDEIHSFVNAGSGTQGAETAGNMLKAKMNEGNIRIIGATTHKELKKFVEHDDAFCRRLESIEVKEPSKEDAEKMVLGSLKDYIDFHKVGIEDSIVYLASKYSDRYMKSKCFPDKLYTVLDHACSHVKVEGRTELKIEDIQYTVSKITGINVESLKDESQKNLLKLEDTIKNRIKGQDEAVKVVSRAIRRGKCGINDPNRPIASFLFVGPTGVGKTELCKVLSKEVALGDASFIKIDMSEYGDKISVNKFIGSAPGYVGYGEGGQLTEKVKHNPYSLILFDEIEKAHPDVFNVFLQILDEGRLTDGEGQTVDFTNCIIVMTSNAGYGADGFEKSPLGFGSQTKALTYSDKEKKAITALESTFKPEFLNRIDNIVIFDKLNKDRCIEITEMLIEELVSRVKNDKGIVITLDKVVIEHIAQNGYSDKYGARNLKREIQNTVEDAIAVELLSGKYVSGDTIQMKLDSDNNIVLE